MQIIITTPQCCLITILVLRWVSYSQSDEGCFLIFGFFTLFLKYYELSGYTYHYIEATSLSNVVIMKMDSDDQITWYKHYATAPLVHAFDVAPDESTLMYFEDTSPIKAYKFNWTDGTFMAAYQQSSMFQFTNPITHLSYSDDGSSVWFISKSPSALYLCSWDMNVNIACTTNNMMTYGAVNSINAFDSNIGFLTIEWMDNSAVEVNKIDLSQTVNYYIYSSKINWSYWQTRKDSLYLDSSNDRIYTALIHDNNFMFLVLQMSTGNQASGTRIFRSNNVWTDIHIFHLHLYNGKVYSPALWDKSTLFVYDISSDLMSSVYQPTSSNFVFRNVYVKNSRLYFTGHKVVSGSSKAWIATTPIDAISTLLDISIATSFPVSIDSVAGHVPYLQSSTNNTLYTASMTTSASKTSLTGTFALISYTSTILKREFVWFIKDFVIVHDLCKLYSFRRNQ